MITGHNVSQVMVEQWWNNITYNLTDFVKSVTVIAVNTKLDIDLENHNDYQTSDAFAIEELSSSLGKCYIFKPLVKFEVRCARQAYNKLTLYSIISTKEYFNTFTIPVF